MNRNTLAKELAIFCCNCKIFYKPIEASKFEANLNDISFVESLINTLTLKTKYRKNVDIEKLKEILLELEKIRLELEYKNYDK